MRWVAAGLMAALFLVAGCTDDDPPPPAADRTPRAAGPRDDVEPGIASSEVLREIPLELGKGLDSATFAVDPQGNVFVLNVARSRVEIYDPNGKLVDEWGERGNGPGEFDFRFDDGEGAAVNLGGLDIDAGNNVYVADAANARVQKFDENGRLLVAWGGEGEQDGSFTRPVDVAVSENDVVYVIDDRSVPGRIQSFSPNGRFIDEFGAADLIIPGSMEFGPDGSLYVANYDGHTVLKFTAEGKLQATWEGWPLPFTSPTDIAISSDGNAYVADADASSISVLDPDGKGISIVNKAGEIPFKQPVAVAIDADDDLYVLDDERSILYEIKVSPTSRS